MKSLSTLIHFEYEYFEIKNNFDSISVENILFLNYIDFIARNIFVNSEK